MSTLKLLVLASLGASSLTVNAYEPIQGSGGNPIKIIGPTVISTTRNHVATDGTYTYEVTLDHSVGVNTVVNISDMTDAAQPVDYSITIPAGQTVGYFDVVAAYSGDDLLMADSTSGAGQLEVTVL